MRIGIKGRLLYDYYSQNLGIKVYEVEINLIKLGIF